MRTLALVTALPFLAICAPPPPSAALEREAAAFDDDVPAWSAGATCTVSYFNTCTGWTWIWDDWDPTVRIGTVFEGCGSDCRVLQSFLYFPHGAPAGWGFTGLIGLWNVDGNDCPTDPPVASNALLAWTGWASTNWPSVPVGARYALAYQTSGHLVSAFEPLSTDHPAAGPNGPQACGTCFPTTRTSHTYYWGPVDSPLCPGSRFWDGTCDAELLVSVAMNCTVGLRNESWGRLKQLYR